MAFKHSLSFFNKLMSLFTSCFRSSIWKNITEIYRAPRVSLVNLHILNEHKASKLCELPHQPLHILFQLPWGVLILQLICPLKWVLLSFLFYVEDPVKNISPRSVIVVYNHFTKTKDIHLVVYLPQRKVEEWASLELVSAWECNLVPRSQVPHTSDHQVTNSLTC